MSKSRRIALRNKLLIGLGGVGLLVIALLLLSDHTIRSASSRLEDTIKGHVHPLAQLNRLQLQINLIRGLEIEIPRISDYFAVTTHLERLHVETENFSKELAKFIPQLMRQDPVEGHSLDENWRRYQEDLKKIVDIANNMDLREVERISTYESLAHFRAISRVLSKLGERTELKARQAFERAPAEYTLQRQLFIFTSMIGLIFIAAWGLFFSRSISGRLSLLRDGAIRIAEGKGDRSIDLSGNDELLDLCVAFNTMQEKVQAREQALRIAHNELEDRVVARTQELNNSNFMLKREIEERQRAEEQLRLLSQAVEQSPVGVMIIDAAGHIQYVNQSLINNTGYTRAEIIGNKPQLLGAGDMSPEEYDRLWKDILSNREWEGDLLHRRRDGSIFWEHVRVSAVTSPSGKISHYLAVGEDITLRKEHEQKILYQAQYDALTDLPNRVLAMDRLSQSIVSAARSGSKVILMFIDLDDFKRVNDTLGHDAGDQLLVQAAQRLKDSVRADDTVARQGGDEFLVIMAGVQSSNHAKIIAEKIIDAFRPSFRIGSNEVVVSPSIGLAIYPDDGKTPGVLLRNADLAMYEAKEAGRNIYRMFNQNTHDHTLKQLELERGLRHALEKNELLIMYQPLVGTISEHLMGAEALLRWESPEHGTILPDQFIPIAERAGMIAEIGMWVIQTAIAQLKQWHEQGFNQLRIAINVSPRQFRGETLVHTIKTSLEKNLIPPHCLQIEVTEGILIRNQPEVRTTLETLDKMGIKIAMDDFGKGYSSLSYLKRFPFHALKVDREFIRDIATDPDDRALVAAITQMGQALGLSVIAEGVELEEQLIFLKEWGCDYVQGHYFSEPLIAEDFAKRWLKEKYPKLVTNKSLKA